MDRSGRMLRRLMAASVLSFAVALAVCFPAAPVSSQSSEAAGQAAPSSEAEEADESLSQQRKAIEESPFHFELPAPSGSESKFNFADVVAERNLVIYFWSASCPLCLLQTSAVNELVRWAEKHPAVNLEVVSVNLDALGPRVLKLSAVHPEIGFPVFYDPGGNRTRKGYRPDEHGLPAFYFFLRGGLPVRVLQGFSSELIALAKESFLPRPPPPPTGPLRETVRR